uniref:Coiled-coil domain-containing protein 6 n=1 Tax=Mantoniella antarctica TaxID=81844 RepID=A0A7S0SUA3_9CHLO|mmetsp:Transcript_36088/g.90070  ORF Transcript_36088/g.90070 Transcript_36088/m.90070 type:complete len:244 (+) Transcript_36088:291-1022(+)
MSSASDMSEVEELRAQLEMAGLEASREKARAGSQAAELQATILRLKEQNLSAHNKVEHEEEHVTNNLMKKLDRMTSEKREMLLRVEQEEEFLTNSLQKRLDLVLREKAALESQITREHEQASGDLERRLTDLAEERLRLHTEKVELERQLEAEQEYIVNKLQKQTRGLAKEKECLKIEREDLRRQVEKLVSDKVRLNQEKVNLENTMEAEEESIVNRLQVQMLELYQRNKFLERRIEAGFPKP